MDQRCNYRLMQTSRSPCLRFQYRFFSTSLLCCPTQAKPHDSCKRHCLKPKANILHNIIHVPPAIDGYVGPKAGECPHPPPFPPSFCLIWLSLVTACWCIIKFYALIASSPRAIKSKDMRREEQWGKLAQITVRVIVPFYNIGFGFCHASVSLNAMHNESLFLCQDILRDFPGVFLINHPFIAHVDGLQTVLRQVVDNGGLYTFKATGHSIYSATHPSMYSYLPTNTGRLMAVRMWAFTTTIIFNTEKVYKEVLYWWYLCALDQYCISPPNVTVPCPLISNRPNTTHFATYFKQCHRHDQSALNVILANYFNFDVSSYSMFRPEMVIELDMASNEYSKKARICSWWVI